jgi:phosphate-selective porin OprO and OprP
MIGAGYSFNDDAHLTGGVKGSVLPDSRTRDIHSVYADMIFKYRGFAFNADYISRETSDPAGFSGGKYIYTGAGVNAQASYLFARKWEVALRNSTMYPDRQVRSLAGYTWWNQSTLGITRYIIGHSLKVQMDLSYNAMKHPLTNDYDRLAVRFQIELGL